jgi:hypothetical protein
MLYEAWSQLPLELRMTTQELSPLSSAAQRAIKTFVSTLQVRFASCKIPAFSQSVMSQPMFGLSQLTPNFSWVSGLDGRSQPFQRFRASWM